MAWTHTQTHTHTQELTMHMHCSPDSSFRLGGNSSQLQTYGERSSRYETITAARRPPLCLSHMAARRPPSRRPGAAAGRPARLQSPQHGAARKRQQSPDYATPSKRACMPTLILPCPPLPHRLQVTYHPLKHCAEVPDWLQAAFLHPCHAHLGGNLCLCAQEASDQACLLAPSGLELDAGGALHFLA